MKVKAANKLKRNGRTENVCQKTKSDLSSTSNSNQQHLIQQGVKMSERGDMKCQHDKSGDEAEINVNEVSRMC